MAVAGYFSAVIKIVEHTELQSQLVLVGRDVSPVKRQRWIAIAHFEIAKDLIVRAVFFDDINHVLDGILTGSKPNRTGVIVQQVVVLDDACEFFKLSQSRGNVEACNRSAQQRRNVGMVMMRELPRGFSHDLVGTRALSLGGGDQEIVALNRKRAGVPVGG